MADELETTIPEVTPPIETETAGIPQERLSMRTKVLALALMMTASTICSALGLKLAYDRLTAIPEPEYADTMIDIEGISGRNSYIGIPYIPDILVEEFTGKVSEESADEGDAFAVVAEDALEFYNHNARRLADFARGDGNRQLLTQIFPNLNNIGEYLGPTQYASENALGMDIKPSGEYTLNNNEFRIEGIEHQVLGRFPNPFNPVEQYDLIGRTNFGTTIPEFGTPEYRDWLADIDGIFLSDSMLAQYGASHPESVVEHLSQLLGSPENPYSYVNLGLNGSSTQSQIERLLAFINILEQNDLDLSGKTVYSAFYMNDMSDNMVVASAWADQFGTNPDSLDPGTTGFYGTLLRLDPNMPTTRDRTQPYSINGHYALFGDLFNQARSQGLITPRDGLLGLPLGNPLEVEYTLPNGSTFYFSDADLRTFSAATPGLEESPLLMEPVQGGIQLTEEAGSNTVVFGGDPMLLQLELMRQLQELVESRGGQFVVITIPDPFSVYMDIPGPDGEPSMRDEIIAAFSEEFPEYPELIEILENFSPQEVYAEVVNELEGLGIKVIDIQADILKFEEARYEYADLEVEVEIPDSDTETWEANPLENLPLLSHRTDAHFSPQGSSLVAGFIASEILHNHSDLVDPEFLENLEEKAE